MNRLTKRIDGSLVFPSELIGVVMTPSNDAMCQILTRLAAYEDTGLEPEEIDDAVTAAKLMARSKIVSCFGVDADHIRELVEAEQDGRLVVLPPCTVVCGTTIWWADSNFHTDPIKCEVSSFGIYTGPDGDLQVWMNCYVYGSTPMSQSFRMSSIGKTVFLTREEAEAAMKGGEG